MGAFMKFILKLLILSLFSVIKIAEADTKITIVSTIIPPLLMPNQKNIGFLYELVNEVNYRVSKNTNNSITFDDNIDFLPWLRAVKTTLNHSNKILLPLTRLENREDDFVWIIKLMEYDFSFFTIKNEVNSIESARLLESVAVYRGTSHETFLLKNAFNNLSKASSVTNARMLNAGRVEAWYSSIPEAKWLWKSLAFENNLIPGKIIHKSSLWMAGSIHFDRKLIPYFQSSLNEIHKDGTYKNIFDKYFR